MRLGVRAILLVLAVILFLVAALMDENRFEFMAFGLAVFAASFVVDELLGGSWFGRRR
jgi:hypothetical protein